MLTGVIIMKPVNIIDRGRGPELEGTRITIFTLLPYFDDHWNNASIARLFELRSDHVAAMRKYYASHREAVLADNAKIMERFARGNSPEVEARTAISIAKLRKLKAELRRKRHRDANGKRPPQ
jgi:hypothetical protein